MKRTIWGYVKRPLLKLAYRIVLGEQIRQCQTMEELKRLLFRAPNKDEVIDRLFTKRIEELEAQGQVL